MCIIKKLNFVLILGLLLFAVPVIAQESNKIYTITLNYKKIMFAESLSLVDIKVVEDSSLYTNAGTDYRLEIISSDNQLLQTLAFGLTSKTNNINFTISVPYFKDAKIINIYNKDNSKVLEIQVPQSKSIIDINFNINWLYAGVPILLIFSFLAYIEFKRKREHAELMQRQKQQKIITLRNYVITNLRRGYSKEQIRNALIKSGYNAQDIDYIFKEAIN